MSIYTNEPIKIIRLPHSEGIELPSYAHRGDAGADIRAAVTEPVTIAPGARALIPSGLCFAMSEDLEVQVRSRSGLSLKYGVIVLNSPGTVDASYRGEVGVILANLGSEPFTINRGDRVAQLVVARVERVTWLEVESLDESTRGAGGFGSTGV